MKNSFALLLLFLSGSSAFAPPASPSRAIPLFAARVLEVCMSPGCVADGAQGALDRLQALSGGDTVISPGVCCSLCGNGPVVMEKDGEDNTIKKYKKVQGDKLLELLGETLTEEQKAIWEGCELADQGKDLLKKRQHAKAIPLLEQAIETGLDPAKTSGTSLQWIVGCYVSLASAKLKCFDEDGARQAGIEAYELSDKTSAGALLVLHEIYSAQKDAAAELEALRAYFELPEPAKMSRVEMNQRRELGFRIARLENLVK